MERVIAATGLLQERSSPLEQVEQIEREVISLRGLRVEIAPDPWIGATEVIISDKCEWPSAVHALLTPEEVWKIIALLLKSVVRLPPLR